MSFKETKCEKGSPKRNIIKTHVIIQNFTYNLEIKRFLMSYQGSGIESCLLVGIQGMGAG